MLRGIGLGGDGDEVDAIERVEARFGILFDHAVCEAFATGGDVWRALLKEMRLDEADPAAGAAWATMVWALGDETLDEAQCLEVGPETLLIG
jgi:hypothetical protein